MPSMVLASAAMPALVSAEDTPTMTNPMTTGSYAAVRSTDRVAKRENLKKTNADRELDRRITSLNALIDRINNIVHISADQKAALVGQVQAIITDLTNLKAKIDADTDLTTLTSDKKSIVTTYRVFVFLIPKVTIMAQADRELNIAAEMTANNSAIQSKIQ